MSRPSSRPSSGRSSGPRDGAGAVLTAAVVAAIAAAQAQEAERFDELAAALRGPMASHADTVLSAVVRDLLERQHPDGLAGSDIADALAACVQESAWLPGVDPSTVVIVLLGALGVAETTAETAAEVAADDGPGEHSQDSADDAAAPEPPTDAVLRRHALLLASSLCSACNEAPARAVRAAVDEIHREETLEMP